MPRKRELAIQDDLPVINKPRYKHRWIILLLNLSLLSATYVIGLSFGRFLPELLNEYPEGTTVIFWTGSLSAAIPYLLAYPSLWLYRKTGYSVTYGCAAVTSIAGTLLSIFTHSVYTTLLGYGVLHGIATSLIRNILSYKADNMFPYDDKRHLLVTGMVSLPFTAMFVVIGPLTDYLIGLYGWRITLAIYVGQFAINGVVAICITNRLQRFNNNIDEPVTTVGMANIKETNEVRCEVIEDTVKQKRCMAVSQIGGTILWSKQMILIMVYWSIVSFSVIAATFTPYVIIIQHGVIIGIPTYKGAMLQMIMSLTDIAVQVPTLALGDRLIKDKLRYAYIAILPPLILVNILVADWTEYWQMALYCGIHGPIAGTLFAFLYALCGEITNGKLVKEIFSCIIVFIGIGLVLIIVVTGYIFDSTGSFIYAFYLSACLMCLGLVLIIIWCLLQSCSVISS